MMNNKSTVMILTVMANMIKLMKSLKGLGTCILRPGGKGNKPTTNNKGVRRAKFRPKGKLARGKLPRSNLPVQMRWGSMRFWNTIEELAQNLKKIAVQVVVRKPKLNSNT